LQIKNRKYNNRIIARGISHGVNNYYGGMTKNEKIKRETYDLCKDDDEFYNTYKPMVEYMRSKGEVVKNKFILIRLMEIERKKGIVPREDIFIQWLCIILALVILIAVLLYLYNHLA
jgi:hypothetical protein